ncbi:MAG: FHA domain-containing protein [Bdellovibrionales bacterium]|nr:FHA domain-containing protein [Bdellovibrionales bacterium]
MTVISGPSNAQPARGSSYAVGSGTFSIGRHSQNQIVLESGNVSKRHCVLVVDNTKIAVEDQGSSNGTFVNGKLSAKREIRPGDRISVGEFVLELSDGLPAVAPPRPNLSVVPPPGAAAPAAPLFVDSTHEDAPMPKDPLGKLKYHFDRYVLPYFFGFNERYEWRIVIGSLFGLYLALNLFISLSPLMDEQQRAVEREMMLRAQSIAREVADRNTAAVAAKADSKLDVGTFTRGVGVQTVAVTDLDLRVLAPAGRAGTYFQNPPEAANIAAAKAKRFRLNPSEGGAVGKAGDTIVAVEPIQVLNPALGRNEPRAMVVVALDATLSQVEGGELLMVYAHTLVLSIVIGLFVFYLIYRITLRPFQEMNRKVDQVLRGEHVDFKPSVYFSEIDPLWDLVDSALKRVPRAEETGNGVGGGKGITSGDLAGPLRTIAMNAKQGVAVLDEERKVICLNAIFEEVTGVRNDSSEGQPLASVSRDQAFSSLVGDLCDRAAPGTEGASEEFDFAGIVFVVHVVAFGTFGDPKCFVFNLIRKEE